jgi:colicin import membrane protein
MKITLTIIAIAALSCTAAFADQTQAEKDIAMIKALASSNEGDAPAASQTVAQENACESAQDYLDMMAFSRKGLIRQLIREGYSVEDATYAADVVDADWDEQAAKSAQDYLDTMSFSRKGLINQLKHEGFTEKQAVYGVSQTGL